MDKLTALIQAAARSKETSEKIQQTIHMMKAQSMEDTRFIGQLTGAAKSLAPGRLYRAEGKLSKVTRAVVDEHQVGTSTIREDREL